MMNGLHNYIRISPLDRHLDFIDPGFKYRPAPGTAQRLCASSWPLVLVLYFCI